MAAQGPQEVSCGGAVAAGPRLNKKAKFNLPYHAVDEKKETHRSKQFDFVNDVNEVNAALHVYHAK
jgi:hypothetical protein